MGAWIVLVIYVVVCAVLSAVFAPKPPTVPNAGFKDAAAVIAFISTAAVVIERLIEGLFAAMAGRYGQWWPLSLARDEFDRFEGETNKLLTPVVNQTIQDLNAAKLVAGKTADELTAIQATIDDLQATQARLAGRYNDVAGKLAPGSTRLARVSEINNEITAKLTAIHGDATNGITGAKGLLSEATEVGDRALGILASLQDNPARRIASLILGAGLGMLVAGGVGLNVFVATLAGSNSDLAGVPELLLGTLGIVLTGVVIGLGSAPSHEVIKSLQTYRDDRVPREQLTTPSALTGGDEAVAGVTPSRRLIRRTS